MNDVPLPLPLDEVKCFPSPSGMEYICAPGDDYYSAADLKAYGDAREEACRAAALPLPDAGAVAWRFPDGEWRDIRILASTFRVGHTVSLPHPSPELEYAYSGPSPASAEVDDAMVERCCVAAYNECDMGQFPADAVLPDSDRRFVRAALATYTSTGNDGARPVIDRCRFASGDCDCVDECVIDGGLLR
jgi:hypothetical protein